jgi:glycosyltransferase involved in cell wall biosynthesis
LTISVIIPTYNRENDLKYAVNSVLAQTVLPKEIIIVNDGERLAIFEELSNSSALIKVLHNETKSGANYSRNRGAQLACGDILMFLDDDDTWLPEKIEVQSKILEFEKEIGLVYSGKLVVYDYDKSRVQYKITCSQSGMLYPKILEYNIIGTTSSVAIRSSAFFEAGGFDESLPAMQDYDLWIRVCRKSLVKADGAYHVNYTVNKKKKAGQISTSGNNQEKASKILMKKYREDFLSNGISLKKREGMFLFRIAKSVRSRDFREALPWILRSFWLKPSFKTLFLIVSADKPF